MPLPLSARVDVRPVAVTLGGFFQGKATPWLLTTRIFISWIFAKSVTNAVNLGQYLNLDNLKAQQNL